MRDGGGARRETPAATSAVEGRWVGIATLALLLLTQIPPTVAGLAGPDDRVHVGTYWYPDDFSAYLAAMREAATSPSWLVHSHFSAEPHDPALMFPLYVAIGKASSASGLPLLSVYGAVELAGRALLAVSLYVFAAAFLTGQRARRLAFVLAAFSGGLTVWVGLIEMAFGATPTLKGKATVELMTFGAFLAAPHLALGLAAALAAAVLFGAACGGSRLALWLVGAAVFAVSMLHPYLLPVLLSAFVVYAAIRSMAERRLSMGPSAACALALTAGAPMLLYNFATFTLDPFWGQTYSGQQVIPSPRPWELPIDYGVVFFLALPGVAQLWRSRTQAQTFLLVWLGLTVLWMYAPVPYQHRFAFGLQPGLAVLAAIGWPRALRGATEVAARLRTPLRHRAAVRRLVADLALVLALSAPFTVFLAIVASAATNHPIALYAVDRDTYRLGLQLAERTGPEDVVASSFPTGNVLAGVLPGRVVVGNLTASLRAGQKSSAMAAMYRGDLSPEEARAFLQTNRVSYLIVGPEERRLGPNDPGAQLGLPVALRVGDAIAYRARELR